MNANELETITARQLRQILYFVQDGSKTVEELRRDLFQIEWQDNPVSIGFGMFERMAHVPEPADLTEEAWAAAYGETAEEHAAARHAYFEKFQDDPRDDEPVDDEDDLGELVADRINSWVR